jgi:protein gp37
MSTAIQWTNETWNPMTGCTRISSGCDHCYAFVVANRRTRHLYLQKAPVKDSSVNREDPFAPRFWPERLEAPLHWRKPRRIFVNSMSDVFHAQFTLEHIKAVFEIMNRCARHQFQLLTKRPERAARIADKLNWTSNIWVGTSVENMEVAYRVEALRKIPAKIRFISAEPILGPLDHLDLTGIHWVIGGGESGPFFRPVNPEWATHLRDLCLQSGVAFFWKQWGGLTARSGGRELEGREWNDFPLELPSS